MNTLTYLSNEAFSSIPPELVHDLQRMLSSNESIRPSAVNFTGNNNGSMVDLVIFLYFKTKMEWKGLFPVCKFILS